MPFLSCFARQQQCQEQFLFLLKRRNADLSYCLARFVEFMHHWEANEKPEYMDIAFSSERSIEDELERETYGDIVTIGKPHGTQCCGFGMFIPDPNFFHPGSRIRIKKFKSFNPKKWFISSRNYDPGCSSRIRILTFHPSRIPDPRLPCILLSQL
jgi:hypothetical protein